MVITNHFGEPSTLWVELTDNFDFKGGTLHSNKYTFQYPPERSECMNDIELKHMYHSNNKNTSAQEIE